MESLSVSFHLGLIAPFQDFPVSTQELLQFAAGSRHKQTFNYIDAALKLVQWQFLTLAKNILMVNHEHYILFVKTISV